MRTQMQMYRAAPRWKSKFARFVRTYGVERLAKALKVHPTAIYQWVRGATTPRPAYAAIMHGLARRSRVRLTLDEIYGHSRDLRARARGSAVARRPENGLRENGFAAASINAGAGR